MPCLAPLSGRRLPKIDLTLISPGISDASSRSRLGNGAPITGTAIYLTANLATWGKTWALWTGIVANVPGYTGVTGGWMVEQVMATAPAL
ncbi:hypothetical protein N7499_001908 [Penicillium canescens]|uniref:Uncharacterized protein n=1 Tax=Penicillium canescens TaxID=5083 RepID=A0AAD6N602_PENCN|nr:uncharacterized protein N7446_009443 [Penicillium canescens]KAJ6002226.1 hypothetical protein N7522_007453 [Penicillium canescens]KAJ6034689.1 hypothetical protein N7460_008864 [Penicillium canescens]KAJ6046351.1 hypothetical protein N7444_007605 [Penicillium canescens]KAJ6053431.1 hypothetical protein N7446_009443 [Penicillium canescens]KAJ6097534.1 hypothetical protein N7499_001908 [Penicillium canescens]